VTRLSRWLYAGVATVGMSATILTGAGAARADADDGVDRAASAAPSRPSPASSRAADAAESRSGAPRERMRVSVRTSGERVRDRSERIAARGDDLDRSVKTSVRQWRSVADRPRRAEVRLDAAVADGSAADEPAPRDRERGLQRSARVAVDEVTTPPRRIRDSLREVTAPVAPAPSAPVEEKPAAPAVLGLVRERLLTPLVQAMIDPMRTESPRPVTVLSTLLFGIYSTLTRVLEGPPAVPASLRGAVQVSSSTLVVAEGVEVPADWYIPIPGDDRPAPERLIHLQHGFLANGPMYSHTAAYLAERTNSIVVVTSLTSNPFAAGGMWLGGDAMHRAVAQLYLDDDRRALGASLTTAALRLGRGDVVLPQRFALIGHSLGGGFAPDVAGYYAEGLLLKRESDPGVANDLVGVVSYDGVPFPSVLPAAMARLAALEAGGDPRDYIPVYELAAPLNLFNIFSDIQADLTSARPGRFNGVVLARGVHMDAMVGHNPVIQTFAYLIAGVPRPQNPLAVRELTVGWLEDMFNGAVDPATGRCVSSGAHTCAGQYGDPGDASFVVPTDRGDATATVIGGPLGVPAARTAAVRGARAA
jgi:hypothetical protein